MPTALSEVMWQVIWLTIGGVALLVLGFYLTRWIRSRAASGGDSEPFTLHQLREMREAGQITQQEFEAMRAAMLGRAVSEEPPIERGGNGGNR